MINAVQADLRHVLERFNVNIYRDPIIVATYNLAAGDNFLGFIPTRSMFKYVIICEGFNNTSDIRLAGSKVPGSFDNVIIWRAESAGEYSVIFALDSNITVNAAGVFTTNGDTQLTLPLVSIDYVNELVGLIDFNEDITTLKEVNVADGMFTLRSPLRGLSVGDNVQFYFGNSNMPYSTGSFRGKKLILPYNPEVSDAIVPANCFADTLEVKEVVIPNCYTEIKSGAFKGCANLQHIYIPETIETIEDGAFDGCIYPELVFEVSLRNRKFVGLTGCLLEKNTDNSYSIVHATSCFFDPASPNYFANCTVCLDALSSGGRAMFPTDFNLNNCYPFPGMYRVNPTSGTITLYDISGNILTDKGEMLTSVNTQQNQRLGITTVQYYVPIYYLIKEIKANACVGDTNMTNVSFSDWTDTETVASLWSLQTIGANAFKDCKFLTGIKLPRKVSDYTNYYGWQHNLTIGDSAFESCSSLVTFMFDWDSVTFGDKAFFDCISLISIAGRFLNQGGTFDETTGITTYTNRYYGELWLGHTPALASITNMTGGTATVINNTLYNLVTINNVANLPVLENGCKNTTFTNGCPTGNPNCHWIGENAFYGCTDFGTLYTGELYTIGPSAFYGCTNMTVGDDFETVHGMLYICENAFYNCSEISTINGDGDGNKMIKIQSQAFAYTGVNKLVADYSVFNINFGAKDILDGCVITQHELVSHGGTNDSPYQLQPTIDCGLVIKNAPENNILELLKGTYRTFIGFPTVDAIASNAFDGVTDMLTPLQYIHYNLGDVIPANSTYYKYDPVSGQYNQSHDLDSLLPYTITGYDDNNYYHMASYVDFILYRNIMKLGSYILVNTTVDSQFDNCTKRLQLPQPSSDVIAPSRHIYNDPEYKSVALLLKVGGKYFENIINNTAYKYGDNSKRYYYIEINGYSIALKEHSTNGDKYIWTIGYNNNGSIEMTCTGVLGYGYDYPWDDWSCVTDLGSPVTLTLIRAYEYLTPNKQSKILSPNIVPGTQWRPTYNPNNYYINVPNIPSQLLVDTTTIIPYNPSEYAFAETPWIDELHCARDLTGMNYGFMNCTSLNGAEKLPAGGSIFNGVVSEGLFDGCTSLNLGFDNDVPVEYEDYCLRNTLFSTNIGGPLQSGNKFGAECFANTNIEGFLCVGIEDVNTTAFNSNHLQLAVTYGYSGKYFTMPTYGNCIVKKGVNGSAEIVVGTIDSITHLNYVYNIGQNAFRGLKINSGEESRVSFTMGGGRIIFDNAFSGSDITLYNEASNVTNNTIYSKAFANCLRLTAVTLSSNDIVRSNAFSNCTSLTTLSIGAGTTLYQQVFKGCTALTNTSNVNVNVNLPTECFSGCTSLTSFTTKANIINGKAFEDCTSMTTINLTYTSSDNPSITGSAFKNCPLTQFKSADTFIEAGDMVIGKYTIYDVDGDITLVAGTQLPQGVSFYDELTRETPFTYKYVKYVLGDTIERGTDYILRTGTGTPGDPYVYTSMTADSDIRVFDDDTYYYSNTNRHPITNNIKAIGNYAYCGRGLEGDIIIPDTVTRIGDYAFANNPDITSVNIPSTVKYIGNHAFDGCTNIDYFALPDSCTYLGEAALKGCRLSKGFNCNALDAQYTRYPSPSSDESMVVAKYNNALDLTNNQTIESVSRSAFTESGIQVVRLSNVCSTIGENAFKYCVNLVEVELNCRRTTLDDYCFYGCGCLRDIWLGKDVRAVNFSESSGALYGVGSSVPNGVKILHAPITLQNDSDFITSEFYMYLTNQDPQRGLGYIVSWYSVS